MTKTRTFLAAALMGAWAAFGPGLPIAVGTSAAGAPIVVASGVAAGVALAQSDLDGFMSQVLAKRDENWKKLQQYVLDEHERIDMIGPALVPMMGQRRVYRWFIKDGYFVRSPTTVNGVTVPESERRKSEDEFLRRAKAKDEKAAARTVAAGSGDVDGAQPPAMESQASPAAMDGLLTQSGQPQFVDSAYFLKFKFEQGKYALVGREQVDGRDVLRIEYYPARLFTDAEDRAKKSPPDGKPAPDRRQDQEIERLMNKNSLVTLWVEPSAKQIVKYSFDNIQTDFLPIAWLFRLEDIKASMTMSQPFKDIWLPKDVDLLLKAMFALGTIDLRYHLDYVDYREATTSGRIRRGGLQ